jgi:hypothetical protein
MIQPNKTRPCPSADVLRIHFEETQT